MFLRSDVREDSIVVYSTCKAHLAISDLEQRDKVFLSVLPSLTTTANIKCCFSLHTHTHTQTLVRPRWTVCFEGDNVYLHICTFRGRKRKLEHAAKCEQIH